MMKNANEPASPFTEKPEYQSQSAGLTKREHFAAIAMQGLLSRGYGANDRDRYEQRLAVRAVVISDALLLELDK